MPQSSKTLKDLEAAARKKGVPLVSTLTREDLESFLSNKPWSLGWRFKYIKPQTKSSKDLRNATEMLLHDARDLKKHRKVQAFLQKHEVSTTMPTSPQRLKKLRAVLATLDVENLSNIYIVLPRRYGRKDEVYAQKDIDVVKKFSPLVQIVRTKKDYGPLTKMLPVLRKTKDRKAILISIDDDVAYPMGMVNEMIFQKVVKHPNAVIEGGASFFRRKDIRGFQDLWPEKHKKRKPHTDLVEGWEAVAYNRKLTDTAQMEQIADLSRNCYLSDDLVISFVLAKKNITRVTIDNRYSFNPHPYDYGTEADALHRGGGSGCGILSDPNVDDFTWEKYLKCLKDICQKGWGPASCKKQLSKED